MTTHNDMYTFSICREQITGGWVGQKHNVNLMFALSIGYGPAVHISGYTFIMFMAARLLCPLLSHTPFTLHLLKLGFQLIMISHISIIHQISIFQLILLSFFA